MNKLKEVSNFEKVKANAKKYDDRLEVNISSTKNKKYVIIHPETGRKVNFGDVRYADYTFTGNDTKREAYLSRANKIRGNWKNDKFSPNNLSIHLLWN